MALGVAICHTSRNRLGNRVRAAAMLIAGVGKLARIVCIDKAQTRPDAQDAGRGR